MPTLKTRIIKRENGEVVVKTTSVFSPEEAENIPRIADDVNANFDTLRSKSYDLVFVYLRILHFWGEIWNSRDQHSKMIVDGMERKKAKIKRMEGKKRRKRR